MRPTPSPGVAGHVTRRNPAVTPPSPGATPQEPEYESKASTAVEREAEALAEEVGHQGTP